MTKPDEIAIKISVTVPALTESAREALARWLEDQAAQMRESGWGVEPGEGVVMFQQALHTDLAGMLDS